MLTCAMATSGASTWGACMGPMTMLGEILRAICSSLVSSQGWCLQGLQTLGVASSLLAAGRLFCLAHKQLAAAQLSTGQQAA